VGISSESGSTNTCGEEATHSRSLRLKCWDALIAGDEDSQAFSEEHSGRMVDESHSVLDQRATRA